MKTTNKNIARHNKRVLKKKRFKKIKRVKKNQKKNSNLITPLMLPQKKCNYYQ